MYQGVKWYYMFGILGKNMISVEDDWYIEKGRQIKYAYIFIVKFMHTFLLAYFLLLVIVMILRRVPSLLSFHIIIKFC